MPDLIVCESEARLESLVKYAAERQLSFVPFRVLVCSGWEWGSIYMEDGYPETNWRDMQEHGSRHGVELQPIDDACELPSLLDLNGSQISRADWQQLAKANGCLTSVSPDEMKAAAVRRVVEAEKVDHPSNPSQGAELVWLSLGSYDNILALRRTGLRKARERKVAADEGAPSLKSWNPMNAPGRYSEGDERIRNELSSLKVPTPTLSTLRAEYNHWSSATLPPSAASPGDGAAAAAYQYTMQAGVRVILTRYSDYCHVDRWETDAAFEASARTWLTALGVAAADVHIKGGRVVVRNLSPARLRTLFNACGELDDLDEDSALILPATCGEMAGARLLMPVGMEALDLLVSPKAKRDVRKAIDELVAGSGRTRALPLAALPGGPAVSPAGGGGGGALDSSALFHWDAEGKACFTKDEALRASAHMARTRFDERLRAVAGATRSAGVLAEHGRWCNDEMAYMEASLFEARGMVLLQE